VALTRVSLFLPMNFKAMCLDANIVSKKPQVESIFLITQSPLRIAI
jgi:hypothetical protein